MKMFLRIAALALLGSAALVVALEVDYCLYSQPPLQEIKYLPKQDRLPLYHTPEARPYNGPYLSHDLAQVI